MANAVINASKGTDIGELLKSLVETITIGLLDVVPTVRYAASISARTFF